MATPVETGTTVPSAAHWTDAPAVMAAEAVMGTMPSRTTPTIFPCAASYLATPKIILAAPPFAPAPDGRDTRYTPPPPVVLSPSAFSPAGLAAEIWTQRLPVTAAVQYAVTSSPGRLYGMRSLATSYPSLALTTRRPLEACARMVAISGNHSSGSPWLALSFVTPSSSPGPTLPRTVTGMTPGSRP